MKITIREAVPGDAEVIAKLNSQSLGYDYPADETEKKLNLLLSGRKDKIFVAVTEGKVVGYIHANDYDTLYFPPMKNIMGIAVDISYQRQGAGLALMEAVEIWAKETNAMGIRLVSGEMRTGAHEFYRKCGFDGEKRQINFKKLFR